MGAVAFDTHAFVKTDILGLEQNIKELRQETKADILGVKRDMKELRLEFNGQFILLKWMLCFVFAGVLSIVMKSFFM